VEDVKAAVLRSQEKLEADRINITRVELEIKTVIQKSAGVEGKLELIPLEGSAHYSTSDTQTISLSLIPEKPTIKLLAPVADELAEAIQVISEGVQEAARSYPAFGLDEASVVLNVGIKKDGKILIVLGASGEKETTHSIKLTIKRQES
jgi:hypothetical protein